ncbi:MAG: serine/threonine-protein phosphatase [Planctomycetales bacterium]|nr:serine/threonine-protein phosphatase [Planctomycetales bacterium]
MSLGSRIWLDSDLDSAEISEWPIGQVASFSRRCPGKASANEDGALIVALDESRAVLAVADGCGGMNAGADASKITLETLKQYVLRGRTHTGSLRVEILDGIEAANSKVLKLGVGAATTLAIVEIHADKVRPYHIGDSQIVMVGQRGKVKLATPAHSPVGYAVEAGVLSESDAMVHEDRHIVSNVVGIRDCHIEVGMRLKMAKRDTLVLATDGIFDNLQVDEVCGIVRKGPLADVAGRLITETNRRVESPTGDSPSKPDDATFLVFRR